MLPDDSKKEEEHKAPPSASPAPASSTSTSASTSAALAPPLSPVVHKKKGSTQTQAAAAPSTPKVNLPSSPAASTRRFFSTPVSGAKCVGGLGLGLEWGSEGGRGFGGRQGTEWVGSIKGEIGLMGCRVAATCSLLTCVCFVFGGQGQAAPGGDDAAWPGAMKEDEEGRASVRECDRPDRAPPVSLPYVNACLSSIIAARAWVDVRRGEV